MPFQSSHRFVTSSAALAVCLIGNLPQQAQAQEFPSRPLSMVVAAAAGGPIDVFGRIMAERMGQVLGKSVIIENVGGAGGMLGGQRAAKAEPDGHTFILGTIATHTFSQLLYKKPLYDAVTDFTPVTLVAELPLVAILRKDFPASNLAEFVAYAREPEQDQLWLRRSRFCRAPRLPAARAGHGRADDARSLSRDGASDAGSPIRPD